MDPEGRGAGMNRETRIDMYMLPCTHDRMLSLVLCDDLRRVAWGTGGPKREGVYVYI